MGTRGYLAYRYQGKYYRAYLHNSAYPHGHGVSWVAQIPRNSAAREKWIAKTASALIDKEKCGELFGWEEHDECTDPDWTLGDLFIEWVYVIDLDNRVLTINGALHFKFDNMPPLRAARPGTKLGFLDYLEGPEPLPEIPAEYLATLTFWPKFHYDPTEAQLKYDELHPIVVGEWGAPTWETLSVSQHLSVNIIKSLVYDHSDELALCSYSCTWARIGALCWNVVNAAATARLLCPPTDATAKDDMLYVFDINNLGEKRVQNPCSASHHYLLHEDILGRFRWFRGCLITFTPRLDDPAYMVHKVVQMVQHLRKHDRTCGVGIIISGWHIVAVTIDGSEVRHSPVLELHDGKELKDGVLLLMRLLSPTFTRSKAPWLPPVSPRPYKTHPILPDDIIRQIIHSTDFDTYLQLPLVSRYFRSIYLDHPRVGHHVLLGHQVTPGSESLFKVRSTNSTESKLTILKRTRVSISDGETALPLWQYRIKFCMVRPVLQTGLAGVFQCHQSGTGSFNPAPVKETKVPAGPVLKSISFAGIMKGNKYPDTRIQALDGVWEMVGVSE